MKLSVVIPVYNEAGTVAELIERVRAVGLPGIEKELIVVNDGSSDGTREALAPFDRVDGVQVHHSPVNLGKGASVRIGFAKATGELVIIQDADLELDPQDYLGLLQPIIDGQADVVYGSRFRGKGVQGKFTFWVANRALAVLTNTLWGSDLTDIETCYKVFRREALDRLTLRASRFEIEPEITSQVLKQKLRVVEVPIRYQPRGHEEGKKISWRDGFSAVGMLLRQRFDN